MFVNDENTRRSIHGSEIEVLSCQQSLSEIDQSDQASKGDYDQSSSVSFGKKMSKGIQIKVTTSTREAP